MKFIQISFVFLWSLTAVFGQNAPAAPVKKMDKVERKAEIRSRMKARIKTQHTAFITQRLELTEAESAQFWAIFNEYEAKLEAIRQSAKPAPADLETLTDADAEKMIAADLDRQTRELELKRDYYQRFKKVLSPARILKLYRAEREFKLMVAKRLGDWKQGKGKGRQRGRFQGADE